MRFSPSPVRTFSVIGLIAALGVASGFGCGSAPKYEASNAPVEGKIRWRDGTDANGVGGTVEFEASGKVVAKADLLADGTFTLNEKLPSGRYRVRVVFPPPPADMEYIPDARFRQFETSGLTATVGDEVPQRISLVMTRSARPNRR